MNRRPASKLTPRWASLARAAQYLDCDPKTVRRYIAAGHLPASRTPNGKTIRVDLNDVDAMLRPIPSSRRSA